MEVGDDESVGVMRCFAELEECLDRQVFEDLSKELWWKLE